MGKPTLTDTKNSKAGKKLARNNGPAEEGKVAFQQSITSFFETGRSQLWTTVDSDSKGKKKNLKLSTRKGSVSKNESQYFIKKKDIQSKSSALCKPTEVFHCEQSGFTKILQPTPAKTLSPSDERNDVLLISSHPVNNTNLLTFSPPSVDGVDTVPPPLASRVMKDAKLLNEGTKNASHVQKERHYNNYSKKLKSPSCKTSHDSRIHLDNNGVTANEDEDCIPPTPSPVGRCSFLNCHLQQSGVDSPCSPSNTSKDLHRNTGNAKVMHSTRVVKNSNTVLEDNAPYTSKDSKECSLPFPDGEATVRMNRKRYKLTRKGKTSKVVSSPLKSQYDHKPAKRSPYHHNEGDKRVKMLGQIDSSVVVAPSKCFVLKSQMKRPAAKGSSPLQKRQQTELPAAAKNMAKCDLQNKLDGLCSNQTKVHLGCPSIKLDQGNLKEDVVDSKIIKSYVKVHPPDGFNKDFSDNPNPSFTRMGKDSQCAESVVLDVVKLPINGSHCVLKEQRKHGEQYIEKTYLLEKEMQIWEHVKSPLKPSFILSEAMQVYKGFQSPLKSSSLQARGEFNTPKNSLAQATEVDSLLEGLVWSPVVDSSDKLNISSKNTTCKALFSSPKAESQIQSPNIVPRDDSSSTGVAFSSSTPGINYSRFLVLEVSRRELVDHQVVARYGRQLPEKVIRLFDGAQSRERFCSLREEWEMTEVEPGDIVHISGTFDIDREMWILDNSTNAYIVVHPDTLISGTTVSMGTKCLRQSILNERCRTESQSEAMLIGTFLHDIFDVAMEYNEFSPETIMSKATGILQKVSYLNDLYSLGKTESWALEKVNEYIPQFSDWARKFVVPFPHPDLGIMDFKTPEYPQSKVEPSVSVSGLKDIEENIWAPRFGLKGKVDATVEVKIDRRQRTRRHRPDTEDQVKTKVIPLELKTGKMFSKLGSTEHRAQVILYTLLMSERQSQAVDSGLLFYMKTGHMVGVPAFLHEKRALVMKRNEVARFMTLNRAGATCAMPAMLRDLNTCRRCSQAQNCTVFHKAVEEGDHGSSGLGTFFDEMTVHMTSSYVKYFAEWFKLVCLEGKELEEKKNQWEIWCIGSWEREKMGRCFSGMELVFDGHEFVNGGFFRHKFVRCEEHPSVTSLQDVPISCGDRIIVSEDPAGPVALSAGVIHEVTKKDVIVLLDRDLAKRYDTTTDTARGSKLYRLDKDSEYNILTTAWSNTVKLFRGDSHRDAELRRQIVDLQSPVFSRNNFSSQTWDIGELLSQLSVQGFSNPALESILGELNPGQRKAVSKALCAHHYALILGMPGTGKTTTISCLVRVLVASGKTVLLTSYTHTAVDNILLKLKEANLDFLRLGQVHKILPELQAYSAHKAAEGIKTVDQLRQFYESKSVVATTCLGVNHALFSQRFFDYCIVDEASQITQPVCIGPLRHARLFILVGDHYQLPPLVQSVEARESGMDVSLFKRLSERHPQAVVSLEHQYRMNRDIMELSNTLIYEHRLKCGTEGVAHARLELPNWDELVAHVNENTAGVTDNWLLDALAPTRSVVFLDTDDVPAPETRSEALVCNETEAWLVQQLTCALVWGGLHPSLLGIISPYRHQIKLISKILNRESHNRCSEIEINTVDKYQGRDKSCIIVSLVRNNEHCNVGDLLSDWRRVNVALTRAKHKLILIGSLSTLKGSLLLQELFDLLERRDWVQALPFGAHHKNPCFTQLAQVAQESFLRTQKTHFNN